MVRTTWHLDKRWYVLWAAFCDLVMFHHCVHVWNRLHLIFFQISQIGMPNVKFPISAAPYHLKKFHSSTSICILYKLCVCLHSEPFCFIINLYNITFHSLHIHTQGSNKTMKWIWMPCIYMIQLSISMFKTLIKKIYI